MVVVVARGMDGVVEMLCWRSGFESGETETGMAGIEFSNRCKWNRKLAQCKHDAQFWVSMQCLIS